MTSRVVELVPGGLESTLRPGDKLLLLPGFSGGDGLERSEVFPEVRGEFVHGQPSA
jgi:hypothetical protein